MNETIEISSPIIKQIEVTSEIIKSLECDSAINTGVSASSPIVKEIDITSKIELEEDGWLILPKKETLEQRYLLT